MLDADRFFSPTYQWYFAFAGSGVVGFLSGHLFFVALPFYLALVWLGLSRFMGNQLEDVKLVREASEGIYEEGELSTRFFLRNDHHRPMLFPKARDRIPFSRDFETETRFPGLVRPGETMVCEYSAPCKSRFGRYTLGPTSLTVSDPLGLVERKRVFEQYQPVTLYPRWEPIDWLPLLGGRRHFAEHQKSNTKTARGQDIYGIREYQSGDPLSHVHWRSVARHDELMVKEFEMPASRSVHVFLDLHQDRKKGLGAHTTRRVTARLAASLSVYAIQSGHQVSLHGEGATSLYLPPGGGMHQQRAILDALVDVKQEGDMELDELLSSSLSEMNDDATVVLVVPTTRIDPDQYVRSLAVLEGRGANVIVFLIDDSDMVRYDGRAEEYDRDWSVRELEESFRAQGAWCRVITPERAINEQIPPREEWKSHAS
jgi:uncharacterized protein (DUF58 family)